jgi:hypothetical protein
MMRKEIMDIEKITVIVRRLEDGKDIAQLADETGHGKAQLYIWLAQ